MIILFHIARQFCTQLEAHWIDIGPFCKLIIGVNGHKDTTFFRNRRMFHPFFCTKPAQEPYFCRRQGFLGSRLSYFELKFVISYRERGGTVIEMCSFAPRYMVDFNSMI